jgi:hypothetical protein
MHLCVDGARDLEETSIRHDSQDELLPIS